MSDEKYKPAHEVLVRNIQVKGAEVVSTQADLKEGAPLTTAGGAITIPIADLKSFELMAIGAFCSMLDVLTQMIIPDDKLEWVISELKTVEYGHARLSTAIEDLEQRKK